MPDPHHLFTFLTREEWRVCYAVQFLDDFEEYADAFDLDRFATPGAEGPAEHYEESFRRAIRFLALEHGFPFREVKVQETGEIYAEEVVEEGNLHYFNLLALGKAPDILGCLRELLDKAPASMNTEPVREAISEISRVRKDIERQAKERGKEMRQEIEAREKALFSWGVTTDHEEGMVH